MATTVKLTVLTGPHRGERFCFRGATLCTLGRAHDCFVRLAGGEKDLAISRHHCQLDINPPCVLVQDLGSANGTYVNGKKLEPAGPDLVHTLNSFMQNPVVEEGGNIIVVGGTTLRIDVVDCPPAEKASEQSVWNAGEVAKRDCDVDC